MLCVERVVPAKNSYHMFYAVFAILLAAVSTIHVRADTTPITPGPGAVFIEGQTCSTSWEVDPSGLWTSTVIELMTGDNLNMVHLMSGYTFSAFLLHESDVM